MENKVDLKCCLHRIVIVVMVFVLGSMALNYWEYQRYTVNYNQKLNAVLSEVREHYPEITEEELVALFESDSEENQDSL